MRLKVLTTTVLCVLVGNVHGALHSGLMHPAQNSSTPQDLNWLAAATSDKGNTPLHHAVLDEDAALVEELLLAGASRMAPNQRGSTPVHFAASKERCDILKALLKQCVCDGTPAPMTRSSEPSLACQCRYAAINACEQNGATPLHIAAGMGHLDAIRTLIDYGANIASKDVFELTAIHVAVLLEGVEAVNLFLDLGVAIEEKYAYGRTLLHFATIQDVLPVIQLLITRGANRDARDDSNFSPAWHALLEKNAAALEALVLNPHDANTKFDEDVTLLHLAASTNNADAVTILIKKGASLSAKWENIVPFQAAIATDNIEAMQAFMDNGVNVNAKFDDGFTGLCYATRNGAIKSAEKLIANGADVNGKMKYGFTPLHVAAANERLNIAKLLLKHNANVSINAEGGHTPLHVAVTKEKKAMIEFLVQHGADVDASDFSGHTALDIARQFKGVALEALILSGADMCSNKGYTKLHTAARDNNVSLIDELLIKDDTRVFTYSSVLTSPLHVAASAGNVEAIEALKRHEPTLRWREDNMFGNRPIHLAAGNDKADAIHALVRLGALVDATNLLRHTALHIAAARGNLKAVKALVKLNESGVFDEDWNGRTPLHHAVLRGHLAVVKFLVDAGSSLLASDKQNMAPLLSAFGKNYDQRIISFILQHTDCVFPSQEAALLQLAKDNGVYLRGLILEKMAPDVASIIAKLTRRCQIPHDTPANADCPICMSAFDGYFVHFSCGHEICEDCILEQIKSGNLVCAICRTDFDGYAEAIVKCADPSNDEYESHAEDCDEADDEKGGNSRGIGAPVIAAIALFALAVVGLVLEMRYSLIQKARSAIRARRLQSSQNGE